MVLSHPDLHKSILLSRFSLGLVALVAVELPGIHVDAYIYII